jgi:hypothetical protein
MQLEQIKNRNFNLDQFNQEIERKKKDLETCKGKLKGLRKDSPVIPILKFTFDTIQYEIKKLERLKSILFN